MCSVAGFHMMFIYVLSAVYCHSVHQCVFAGAGMFEKESYFRGLALQSCILVHGPLHCLVAHV